MKRPGIYTAGAVGALALAAVSMQVSPPHAQGHETASAPKVTVQHWAGGTYTPAARSARVTSTHATSLERSTARAVGARAVGARAVGARGLSTPAPATRNIPVEDNIPGTEHAADPGALAPATAATPAPRRGA